MVLMHPLTRIESYNVHWGRSPCSHCLLVSCYPCADWWPNSISPIDSTGTNVDVLPDMIPLLTDKEVATIAYGSQIQLAAWYTYTALICTSASSDS
jgi:hypothetical protein